MIRSEEFSDVHAVLTAVKLADEPGAGKSMFLSPHSTSSSSQEA